MIVGAWLVLWTLTQPNGPPSTPPVNRSGATPSAASKATLKDMVDAARTEGELQVSWSGPLDEAVRQNFEAGFNRQFGFRLTLRIAPVAPTASGGKPPWDLLLGSQTHSAELARTGLLSSHDWSRLFGAPVQAALFDGGALAFAHQIVQPAYNAKRVPAGAAPTAWEVLLEAKWRGRLGVSSAVDVWADLSSSWGDDRASQFVQGLAAQQPVRGTPDDLEQKLEDGAIDILAAVDDRLLRRARERAAAVAPIEVQPLLLQAWVASPLREAAHPNAAALFAGFLVTEEGQQLWQQHAGESSIFSAGSAYQKRLEGKQYVLAGADFSLREQPARASKYARLLGY